MHLFWRRGYADTAVRDLVEELGVNPSSMYRILGDKHQLFLRALDRYADCQTGEVVRRITAPGPAAHVLRDWLQATVDDLTDDTDGCLMVNTGAELGDTDPGARDRVVSAFEGMRTAIASTLERGIADGSLDASVDVEAASRALLTTVLGLRVLARVATPGAAMLQVVEHQMAGLLPASQPAQ